MASENKDTPGSGGSPGSHAAHRKRIRVGLISPIWLPRHGGAEQYDHRLALALRRQGFDVLVLCGTSARADADNGEIEAERFTSGGDLDFGNWIRVVRDGGQRQEIEKVGRQYAFMDRAVAWSREHALDIAIIGNSLQSTNAFHARELYLQLRLLGIRVGCTHHDLAPHMERALVRHYREAGRDWEAARVRLMRTARSLFRPHESTKAFHMIGSPLFFAPDFVISNSRWSESFIDPWNTIPKIVVHPFIDPEHWRQTPRQPPSLSHRDVLMVNPQGRKNPEAMISLLRKARTDRTFRILEGGWGRAFATFVPAIGDVPAVREGRVELSQYVRDIREAYLAAGVVFFPSLLEGYGMTAVEPMYCGIPVVASSYPAVLEAVGEGARTLCPYFSAPQDWCDAVEDVLAAPEPWRARGAARAAELDRRQADEISALADFLTGLL